MQTARSAVAQQLAVSDPMREWQGVASRLQCGISMFRSENARIRNLDSRDIRAFASDAAIDFPRPVFECGPEVMGSITAQAARLSELSAACESLSSRVRLQTSPADQVPPAALASGGVAVEGMN